MVAERADIVVVVDGAGSRPRVLTQRDVIERVVLAGADLGEAVAGVMTGRVVSLPLTASPPGRLALACHDLRHLVVVDGRGALAGLVSRVDLYTSRSLDVEDLVEAIPRPPTSPPWRRPPTGCAKRRRDGSKTEPPPTSASGSPSSMISWC
jgi:CBS domain-containing protein